MQTFDLDEVRKFSDSLSVRLARCQNGEGVECADLDAALQYHAYLCTQYLAAVRDWMGGVFAGTLRFDPAIESEFRDAGSRLLAHARRQLAAGQSAEEPCWKLYGMKRLDEATTELAEFFNPWITPQPSVGPSPRLVAQWDAEKVESLKRRLVPFLPPKKNG
ncbi:MAG TPA: hypothetical protein VGE52_21285 [Pirellulales bacterium]